MNQYFIIIFSLTILVSCAKKQAIISPEPTLEVKKVIKGSTTIESSISENLISDPSEESLIEIDTDEGKEQLSNEETELNEIPEIKDEGEPQVSIQKDLDFDQLFPDSIWTEYMTKRGDYLSLIAYEEYNNANEWRRIYHWNKKHWEEKGIGPDRENPNFIYPYRELDLKKPAENAIEWAYDHYTYIVKEGETLWSIAQKAYGDELAWVVLFWDNEKLLEKQDGKLTPGMELKVRSELWPDIE